MKNSVLDLVKGTPNVLEQIYSDLASPSVKAVGQALGTVLEFSTSFLLPVKLLNEKVRLNFKKHIAEYEKKLGKIPEDKRCEVHPQIGTPIIERLSYTINEDIADLFTTLLSNASNIDMVNTAHPAFVTIIERLSPDEAKIIKYLAKETMIPYVNFGIMVEGKEVVIETHLNLLHEAVSLDFAQNINAYLSNLVSLGIICDYPNTYQNNAVIYDRIIKNNGLHEKAHQKLGNYSNELKFSKGLYEVTDFGKLFIKACIK